MTGPRITYNKDGVPFYDRLYTEQEFQQIMATNKLEPYIPAEEILLILDGKVQDSAVIDTVSKRNAVLSLFRQTMVTIKHEQPNADIRIDIRESIQ